MKYWYFLLGYIIVSYIIMISMIVYVVVKRPDYAENNGDVVFTIAAVLSPITLPMVLGNLLWQEVKERCF